MSTKLNDVSIPDNSSGLERTLAQTICRLSVSKGARDYPSEEYQTLYERFLRLGNIYVAKKAYPKAVALYNMSLRIARDKLNLSTKVTGEVELRLLETEQKFLKSVLKDNAPILNHDAHQKQIKGYKDHLEQFREATRQALKVAYEEIQMVKNERGIEEAEKKKVELIRAIFKNIAAEIRRFVQVLLKDCFNILGKPPCGYAIVGLGSLAREEATPYSDFEFAILISEEGEGGKNKEYFRHLTDLLHLKVINLGETIIPAMAIESLNPIHGRSTDFFFDDITPRGFAFDGAMPQACKTPHGKKDGDGKAIFELIETPQRMAEYHGKAPDGRYWFEVDPHLTPVLANGLCLDGDEALVKNYQDKMCEVLDQPLDPKYAKEFGEKQYSLGQYVALKLLQENSEAFDPNLDKLEDAGRLFDAKKDLYRIPNLIIDALGLLYGFKHFGNSAYKLEKLCAQGVLKSEVTEQLKWVLIETMQFRLDTYLHYKAQSEQMNPLLNYFVVKAANPPIKDLKQSLDKQFAINDSDFESLHKIYQILIPLQDAIFELIKGDGTVLQGLYFKVDAFIQGKVFVRLLQYSRAIESFKKALEENVKLYGEEDRILGSIFNFIGIVWNALRDSKKAVEYHEKALAIHIKHYGLRHPDVATSYNNLGGAWKALGDAKKAVEYYGKALVIQIKLDGPEHPDVARSCNNLGAAWDDLGDVKKAVEYCERSLAIRIKVCRPQHPDVAESYNNLGVIWYTMGDVKKAVEYNERSLAIVIRFYGPEHPHVAENYNNLGAAWRTLGDAKKAVECHERALAIFIKYYGSEHPDVAVSYHYLGAAWRTLRDAKKAVEYLEKGLVIQIKRYGQEHPDVAASYNGLGLAWRDLRDAKKAVEYHDRALAIRIKHYGSEHPDVAESYNNLGGAWRVLGDAKKAIEYNERSLAIVIRFYGPEHPHVAENYNNLGAVWYDLGDAKKAVEYHDRALAIWIKRYGSEHPDVAESYNNLGGAWRVLGDAKKAVEYHNRALAIWINRYGPENPHIATSYNNLSLAWHDLKDPKKAIRFQQEALIILINCYGPQHVDVGKVYYNLGQIWFSLDDIQEALKCFNKVINIFNKDSKLPHPDLNEVCSLRDHAFKMLQEKIKNQKERKKSDIECVVPLSEKTYDYVKRLQLVLNENIVRIDQNTFSVALPISWLRQLSNGAICELSRELQDNKFLLAFKRKL